jgi:hypothetical protein
VAVIPEVLKLRACCNSLIDRIINLAAVKRSSGFSFSNSFHRRRAFAGRKEFTKSGQCHDPGDLKLADRPFDLAS